MSAYVTTRERGRQGRRRALEAHALHADGLSYKAVGERLGVCPSRACELARKGARIIDRDFQPLADALALLQARTCPAMSALGPCVMGRDHEGVHRNDRYGGWL